MILFNVIRYGPDPEAAIGCIPDEMQKGPDKPRF